VRAQIYWEFLINLGEKTEKIVKEAGLELLHQMATGNGSALSLDRGSDE
jgi:hypothetical protein